MLENIETFGLPCNAKKADSNYISENVLNVWVVNKGGTMVISPTTSLGSDKDKPV